MKFVELNDFEFDEFANKHPQRNYVQSSNMAKLKNKQGNDTYLVGVKEGKKIIAATMMFSMNTSFNKKIYYAPRGFLLDYHNLELLSFFTKKIKEFIKKRNGIKLIIDPKVPYQLLDSIGTPITDKDTVSIMNLKKIGYKHFGFNKNFETIQVRYSAIIPIVGTYEEMLKNFTKTTRKHLQDLTNSAIKVRKGTYEDLKIMEELFRHTAENKHFEYKNLNYYQEMYKIMPDIMNIYIAYIDFEYEKRLLEEQLKTAIKEKDTINAEMKKINVGAKMLKKLEQADNKINKINETLVENEKNVKKYGNLINVGSLLSIESGDEFISLTSGMLEDFKHYNPKYAMYNEHIKDAINKNKKVINFYGISGNLDPKSNLYKIYELKKGFNCQIVELIGQFSLPISMLYYFYEAALHFKQIFTKQK